MENYNFWNPQDKLKERLEDKKIIIIYYRKWKTSI